MTLADRLNELYPAHIAEMRRRYDALLAAGPYDRIVIFAGAPIFAFLDDNAYPFRVNPHFKSWVPILNNPHCALIIRHGEKPLLAYHQPVDYWHRPAADPSGFWVEHFDIRMIATPDELRALIGSGKGSALIGENDGSFDSLGFDAINPNGLLDPLHYARGRKTDYEIECMREANRIGARGHVVAAEAYRRGESEFAIHLEFLRATSHIEEGLPYGNIIALNENGSVLHYQQHLLQREPSPSPKSFLIDAGAQFNGYSSDITRTYSHEHDEFERLIEAMDRMQQEMCAAVKPGADYKDLHLLAHQKIGAILGEFGITDLDADAAVRERVTAAFFPHGLGHFIGLQVHDVGGFMSDERGGTIPRPEGHPFLRLTRVIEERHSFTIEPGLYFIDSLLEELRKSSAASHIRWDRVEAFRPYGGIRIEDDVVVTATGHENLTRDAFASL